jgi:hypothetical protein
VPAVELEEYSPAVVDHTRVHSALRHSVEHAAHFLPAQGPVTVFVHHNTLHAFEHLAFDEGVQAGGRLYGCHAYLPEGRYREKLERGRIRVADLEVVLLEDLRDEADRLVANFGTRYALRLAMLQFPLYTGSPAELRWVVAETDALRKFRDEVAPSTRSQVMTQTQNWLARYLQREETNGQPSGQEVLDDLLEQFDPNSVSDWDEGTAELFVLNFLWRVCCNGIRQVPEASRSSTTQREVGRRPDGARSFSG